MGGSVTGERGVWITCPYCFESIEFFVETLHGNQTYVEDCQVCCNPIDISYEVSGDEIVRMQANRSNT